jgi:hypothetical protein
MLHSALWCLWAYAHALVQPRALHGLIFIVSIFWLALPPALALFACRRLVIGVPVPPKVPKSPLLSYIGLWLPAPIRIALET